MHSQCIPNGSYWLHFPFHPLSCPSSNCNHPYPLQPTTSIFKSLGSLKSYNISQVLASEVSWPYLAGPLQLLRPERGSPVSSSSVTWKPLSLCVHRNSVRTYLLCVYHQDRIKCPIRMNESKVETKWWLQQRSNPFSSCVCFWHFILPP